MTRSGTVNAGYRNVPILEHDGHISEQRTGIDRKSVLPPERQTLERTIIMFKTFITAAVATAVIGTAAITAPTQAEAHGGVGLGIAAGLVGGAIIGSAIANNNYNNGYYGRPVVYEDGYVHCHRVAFVDSWGYEHVRRVCR